MNVLAVDFILSLFWLLMAAGVLLPGLFFVFDWRRHFLLDRFYLFGKLKTMSQERFVTDVPKRFFLHFYVLAVFVNIFLFSFGSSWSNGAILFLLHICRRIYECSFVHQWNQSSRMSLIHYLVGLLHYPAVALTMIVDGSIGNVKFHSPINDVLGLIIFLYANYVQYRVHDALANTRQQKKNNEIYPIPTGFWLFDYFSCPNYIAEIFIYLSFLLLSHQSLPMVSLTIWVFVNQSLSSIFSHRWYQKQYGRAYPQTRSAILPFIF